MEQNASLPGSGGTGGAAGELLGTGGKASVAMGGMPVASIGGAAALGGSANQSAGSGGASNVFSSGGSGGQTLGAGGALGSGGSVSGGGASTTGAGAVLDGQRWEMMCGAVAEGDDTLCYNYPPGTSSCPQNGNTMLDKTLNFGGTPGTTYDVALRFRGIVEPKVYEGGTVDTMHFRTGGTPSDSNYNVYSVEVSSPHQVYYVNSDVDEGHYVFGIDSTETIKVDGGATIKLFGNDINCISIANVDGPKLIPNVPPAPAEYHGQFVQMNLISVTSAN